MVEDKIREVFPGMIVLKDPKRSEFFSNLSIPSYMRDWLVMKFSDNQGIIEYDSILTYVRKFIPDRDAFQVIKYQLMQGGIEKFLARVRMDVNLKKGIVQFELPDFGGSHGGAAGIVSNEVLDKYANELCATTHKRVLKLNCLGNCLAGLDICAILTSFPCKLIVNRGPGVLIIKAPGRRFRKKFSPVLSAC